MRHRLLVSCISFLVLAASPIAIGAAADTLPTTSDIKEAFNAEQYPQVLLKLNRVLVLKGKAAQDYNRHDLLLLKGETHLRMKALSAAAQAFQEASKEAADGPTAAGDIATELLVRKSTGTLAYQPKAKDPADKTKSLPPIDIVEPESRKKAIQALFTDEFAATETLVKAAKQGRSISNILQALPTIRNTRWLEMAATGKDDKSKAMVVDLAARAKTLLEATLKDYKTSVDDVERAAMEVTTAHVPVNDKQTGKILYFVNKYKYRGPSKQQMNTIQDVVSTCSKIYDSCDELGGSLGSTGKEFDSVKEEAKSVGTKANNISTHDWRQVYDNPPPGPPPPAK